MNERIIAELSQEEMTPFHSALRDKCVSLVGTSRNYMQTFYDTWEERHKVYRAFRVEDKADKKAQEESRPVKQVLPMTYAKIQTFVSFVSAVITQRPRVFELDAVGVEDHEYKELSEKVLDADVKHNNFNKILKQATMDIAKFGIGIVKHSWDDNYVYVPIEIEGRSTKIFGIEFKGKSRTETQKILKRQGNTVRCVSPFDFFPDIRYPLTEFQKGEFCADESDMSKQLLRRMEAESKCAGVDHIDVMDSTVAAKFRNHARRSRINFDNPEKTSDIHRVTETQIRLTPSEFILSDGQPLGPEKTPIMYLVWLVNDQRVLRCEPMGYLHGEFTHDVGQFDEDQHDFINQSLADVLERLQETMDWFMNARVESVTRTIDNQLVVDPLGVDMATIVNRSRVILLKKGASRTGVDRYVKQLQVQDVTARHMDDIGQIASLMQTVSGVNENAMGQYHTGRRSATEARVVAQGAASRLKNITESIWHSMVQPLGLKMLLNLRQGLSNESLIAIAGQEYLEKPELVERFLAAPEDLVRQADFFMYDGTLASEKAYLAQSLMELFTTVTALGPQGLVDLQLSPKLLIEKIYELLGVGSLDQFNIMKDPQTLQRVIEMIVQQSLQQYATQQQQLPGGGSGSQPDGNQAPAA